MLLCASGVLIIWFVCYDDWLRWCIVSLLCLLDGLLWLLIAFMMLHSLMLLRNEVCSISFLLFPWVVDLVGGRYWIAVYAAGLLFPGGFWGFIVRFVLGLVYCLICLVF